MKEPSLKTKDGRTYLMLGNKKVMECGGLIKEMAKIQERTGRVSEEKELPSYKMNLKDQALWLEYLAGHPEKPTYEKFREFKSKAKLIMQGRISEMVLKEGTEIYYSGDMANSEGFGAITKIYSDEYGDFVDIKMDDGRKMNRLYTSMFSEKYSGNGSTRFVTKEAYKEYKNEIIRKYREKYQGGSKK